VSAPPVSVDSPSALTRSLFSLMSARGAGLFLRIAASLIAARIAGPEAIGFVAWIGIFSMYALWFTGGVFNGAERLVPIRRAQDRGAEVQHVWGVASMVCLLSVATCVLLGAAAWLLLFQDEASRVLAWKLLCAGTLSGITLFMNYASAVFTAENRLSQLNRLFFLEGVLWWVFLPLAWGGTPGLTLRTLLVALLPAVICIVRARAFYRPAWNGPTARILVRDGLPILFSRFLLLLSFGLDRTLIAFLMDDRSLGYYVLAISVIGLMRIFQYAISRVLIPALGRVYGSTRNPRKVARTTLQSLLPLLLILLPCIVIAWFLMEPVTRWLLPEYLPGVPAGRIALISGALISVLGTNIFYVTIGRQKTLSAMLIAGLLVQAAVSFFLFARYGTLESFAWGLVAGAATSTLLVNGGILYYALRPE